MKARVPIALMLYVVPAATLSLMSLQYSLHVAVCAIALVGLTGYVDWRHIRWAKTVAFSAIPLAFAAKLTIGPPLLLGNSQLPFFSIGLLDYTLAFNVAQGVLCFQAVVLFVGWPGEPSAIRLPRLLPLPAAIVVILAGVIPTPSLGGWRDFGYQSLSVALAVVTGLYFAANPRNRVATRRNGARRFQIVLPAAFVIALIAVSGWFFAILIYRFGQDFDLFLGNYIQGRVSANMVGFSPDGRFGNITRTQGTNENVVALRIESPNSPGYMRGKVFDTYEPPRWLCDSEPKPVASVVHPPEVVSSKGERWFVLNSLKQAESGPLEIWTVYPSGSFARLLFSPLSVSFLGAAFGSVSVDDYGAITASESQPDLSYRLAVSSSVSGPPPSDATNDVLIRIPEKLDPRVQALATEITSGCTDDGAKILAVRNYLAQTCQYDLAGGPEDAPDPVSAFLLDKKRGHCEYFASAAVVLMRCAGIPARYVTGFVADEFNPFASSWVARNKDAHAWAEAYLEGSGWVTVEATPGNGVPTGEASRFRQFWEFVKGSVGDILRAIRDNGVAAFAGLIITLFQSSWSVPVGVLIVALVACAVIGRRLRRHLKMPRRRSIPDDPSSKALQSLLARMDDRERERGLIRSPSETLHHFAMRIDSAGDTAAAGWYRTYAVLRYGDIAAGSARGELENQLAQVLNTPSSKEK